MTGGRTELHAKEELVMALRAANGNASLAAHKLGMSRRAYYYALDRHSVVPGAHRAWAKLHTFLAKIFGKNIPPIWSCPFCGTSTALAEILPSMDTLVHQLAVAWTCPNCKRSSVKGALRAK